MSRFVKPIVKRLMFADRKDFIEVKQELSIGDQRRLEAAGMKRVQRKQPNGLYTTELEVDWETFSLARAEVWLTGWSLTNEQQEPVSLTYSAIKALTPETFAEIEDLISGHILAMDQEKKLKATPSASDGTTTS